MDHIEAHKVNFDMFMTVGMPFETEKDIPKSRALIRRSREKYPHLRWVLVMPMQMEPGSPMFNRPDRFGITTSRRCFMDFYHAHARADTDPFTCLGYANPDYFEDGSGADEETFSECITQVRCRYFCLLNADNPDTRSLRGQTLCKGIRGMRLGLETAGEVGRKVQGLPSKRSQPRPRFP
jgi:hypothetical protein